jgi:hypothetical protein
VVLKNTVESNRTLCGWVPSTLALLTLLLQPLHGLLHLLHLLQLLLQLLLHLLHYLRARRTMVMRSCSRQVTKLSAFFLPEVNNY